MVSSDADNVVYAGIVTSTIAVPVPPETVSPAALNWYFTRVFAAAFGWKILLDALVSVQTIVTTEFFGMSSGVVFGVIVNIRPTPKPETPLPVTTNVDAASMVTVPPVAVLIVLLARQYVLRTVSAWSREKIFVLNFRTIVCGADSSIRAGAVNARVRVVGLNPSLNSFTVTVDTRDTSYVDAYVSDAAVKL
jgi:hypothetical protein